MIQERHPFHKQYPLGTIIPLLGCLSILLIPSAFGQVTNPSTGDTIAQYCSNGICHTLGGSTVAFKANHTNTFTTNSANGSVSLTHICIQNQTCNKVITVNQLGRIGLQLSSVCQRMVMNHVNSTCLTYDTIKSLDNTNPLYAGQWVSVPYEHRLSPKIKNHENFNPNPWVIMADPNADFTSNARMIIVDDHFTWTDQNDTAIGGLAMKSHADWYVSSDCTEARVGPSLNLIQEAINYIESNCSANPFNNTKTTYQKEIPFSYANPYSTLHYLDQLKSLLHGHSSDNTNKTAGGLGPQDCIRHQCSYTDPYKKAGW